MQQTWDASLYADHGRFVAVLANSLIADLQLKSGERVLDLGCGDGYMTRQLAESGAAIVGVDASPQMVEAALQRSVDAHCMSGEALTFDQEFDAVFSNAALHWMRDQDAVLSGVYRALKPGGRFVAECGGQGNIAAIRVALLAVMTTRGVPAQRLEDYRFFAPHEYRLRLESHGFVVDEITLTPRPTPLPGGMENWLETFRGSALKELPVSDRPEAIRQMVALLKPVLCDRDGKWTADYVRLRFRAHRPVG